MSPAGRASVPLTKGRFSRRDVRNFGDQRNPGLIISVLPGCGGCGTPSLIGQLRRRSWRLERGEREAESPLRWGRS